MFPLTGNAQSTADYTLSAPDSDVVINESIVVTWTTPEGANLSGDWIGLYRVGDSDQRYQSWKYVSGNNNTIEFTPKEPGSYEFRYFKNSGYTRVAKSNPFTVVTETGGGGQCSVSYLNQVTNYPPKSGPIIAFGDSLTAGVGATNGQDYVSQLSRKVGVPIINAGKSGDTTEDSLVRLQSDVLSRNPSVVIVWLGGNDIISRFYEDLEAGIEKLNYNEMFQIIVLKLTGKIPDSAGITEDETFENLTTVIERIQSTGAIVIVVGFRGGIYDEDLEGRYKQVAETTGSIYVPDVLMGVIGHPSLMSDLVHPDDDGYEIVANRIEPYLRCAL
ncbi:hypothetical protein H6784_05395 [Candidatus Nomurabacteria bacterium]|nr:hypothetical protein [Candidatus Kaiserbacteria bacterium]MCB9814814.1 hypothetical protein [Candidatus Nomurabacteria bacterium]